MGIGGFRFVGVAAVALATMLVGAANAGAAERFAEPNGDGPAGLNQCLEADPCSIQTAIEGTVSTDVVDGDVVTLLPGTTGGVYETQPNLGTGTLDVTDAITVRSREGDPVPLIPSMASFSPAMFVNDSATLQRFRIEYDQTGGIRHGLDINGANVTVERVVVKASRVGCFIDADGALIRDSVCWAFDNGAALGMGSLTASITRTARLRNVTAVGTGGMVNGIFVDAEADQNMTLDAVNTIASGADDVVVQSEGTTDSHATATFTNSNYADTSVAKEIPGPDGSATLTPVGTNGNQTTPPAFANEAAGDFHQLASSSGTIDLGTTATTLLGTLDLDNGSRLVDGDCGGIAEPDIGAYEFVPSCPGPPDAPDATPPDTTITDGPEGKSKKKTATISFSGTDARSVASFQCKLDDGSFETCTSPKTYSKLKKGKHTVEVRAVDDAGNVDPTPASRSWKVKKKRK